MNLPWRVGRRVPIHLYEGERPVGTLLTAEDAARVVAAVNHFGSGSAAATIPGTASAAEPANFAPESLTTEERGWAETSAGYERKLLRLYAAALARAAEAA